MDNNFLQNYSSLSSINQLVLVAKMKCILSDVRTAFLNIIYTTTGFKGLRT
jgi:hypothetical protein